MFYDIVQVIPNEDYTVYVYFCLLYTSRCV